MKQSVLMNGSYPPRDMELLERDYDVFRLWEQPDPNTVPMPWASKVRGIATRGDLGVSAALMNQLPALEVIACYGVGVDGIDLAAAKARGIAVTNTPDVLNDDVADLAIALMHAIARYIPQGDQLVRQGRWPQAGLPLMTRVSGKRLGIIGMGRIGKAIARRAEAFNMEISYHSRTPQAGVSYGYYPKLTDLAAHSDFLIAIVPGGAATAKLVNAEVFRALGPDGFFINVARGSVVDEEAMLTALEQKQIKGAALDVFLNEPTINPRFFALDNAVLHPHGGSATVETRGAMGQLVRDNLAAHFAGKPLLTPV